MIFVRGRIAAAATVLAIAAAVLLAPIATPLAHAGGDSTGYLTRLNHERVDHRRAPLQWNGALFSVAQAWAAHMARTQVLQHNPRLASQVSNWQAVGENVGEGRTISDLDSAFYASPEHRANILDPTYKDVGIGAETRQGTIWIAVVFRDPMAPPVAVRQVAVTAHVPIRPTLRRAASRSHRPDWIGISRQYPLLRMGSVGAIVTLLQVLLRIAPDGIFGPVTSRAVKQFQQRHGLVVDGVVGRRTWHALAG